MAAACKKHGMLIITYRRGTGKMFAFEHDEILPDILALAKTLDCRAGPGFREHHSGDPKGLYREATSCD